mgnify:CR=1 FL=1
MMMEGLRFTAATHNISHIKLRHLVVHFPNIVLPQLLEMLTDKEAIIRRVAAETMFEGWQQFRSYFNYDSVTLLISALKDEDVGVRSAVAPFLANLRDKRAVLPLIEVLKDENYEVRLGAALALGFFDELDAVLPLIDLLNDVHWNVRRTAAGALGRLRDKASVPSLLEILDDENNIVRQEAAFALSLIVDPRAYTPLRERIILEEDERVKQAIAWSLVQLGDFEHIPLLSSALQGGYWHNSVKEQFADTLEKRGTPEAREAVRKWRDSSQNS